MPVTPARKPRQLSLFGVEARRPEPLDLEGLLAGAGQVTRMGGTARVSIVVTDAWRAAALRSECLLRELAATVEPSTVDGHLAVRTACSTALAPLGTRWLRGAMKHPPPGFTLDGLPLRLWTIAAGQRDGGQAFLLRLGSSDGAGAPGRRDLDDQPVWDAAGAALAALGLPAALLGPRAGGPAYRIVGRRRLARLIELVGDPPEQAPSGVWPM
jgi:hypothetical protein